MKRAVIHIGTHKTGTTTIQKTLFSVRSTLLSDAQILYPSIHANQSVHLGAMFLDKPPQILRLRTPRATHDDSVARLRERSRASLEADLANPDWHTLVLSGELLCHFDPKGVARLIEWLGEYVDTVSVVAYVRHPVDLARSAVQQRLKGGYTLDHIYGTMSRPGWQRKFTPWLDVVGLERFRLVSYNDARENEGIMASFCEAAGLPHETIRSLTPDIPTTNESMSHEAALLLDSLNRQLPLLFDGGLSPARRRYAHQYGINAIKSVPGNKFHLSKRHARRARFKSRRDLEWLNATFGTNLFPDVFDNDPIETPLDQNTMPQTTVDALAFVLSDFLKAQRRRPAGKRP